MEENKTRNYRKFLIPGLVVVIIILSGVLVGYLLSQKGFGLGQSTVSNTSSGTIIGSTDEKTFKDTATGTLEVGGLNGDGTHKLIREGGPSQTVYLNSSVVDLDQFVGKKVQIWGETNKGQKAAWLMDVGRIKIIE